MKQCPICSRTYPPEELFCSVHGLPLTTSLKLEGAVTGDHTGKVLEERYRIGGVIGSGGVGVVYEAEQLRIGRRCAVKVLHGGKGADARIRMRFFREVRATARVRHPNVVEIIDFGESDDVGFYFVMEYLEGMALTRIISEESPLPIRMACAVMSQLCAALVATHAQGLVHRDLKPSNIIRLNNGIIKVLDFGLVKPVDRETRMGLPSITTDNMIMGTPLYMSPEHYRAEELDARADVYSLGTIFYEMLVGRTPFDGEHPIAVLEQQLNAPVPLPSRLDPPALLPAMAETILLKSLAKDREERYQSVLELADAVYRLAEEQGFSINELATHAPRHRRTDLPLSAETMKKEGGPVPTNESTPPMLRLEKLVRAREAQSVDHVVRVLTKAFPQYRALDEAGLRSHITQILRAAVEALVRESDDMSSWNLDQLAGQAATEQLSLAEVATALWLSHIAWRPLLMEAAGMDLSEYQTLASQFDQRLLPFYFHLYDRYIAAFQGQMQRLNEALARQNEELIEMRETLSYKVEQTAKQLLESERLKARVIETVSSGMFLVERGTRRILLWNKAMERLSGLPASRIVGETVEQNAHLVEGVPIEEFSEQVAFHEEVGLRKLHVTFRGKEQRTVYVRGQPFYSGSGDRLGTLFVFEDVTEREKIIESLGRYLSKDLVSGILSRGSSAEPHGEQRRAIVLAVKLHNAHAAIADLAHEQVIELLSLYVRSVASAIFARGGTIESLAPNQLLAYFANYGENAASAVEASIELAQRLEAVNTKFGFDKSKKFSLSAGLHIGDVLLLNVGGDRLMMHTVVGKAIQTTEALLAAADAGHILVSAELSQEIGKNTALIDGPKVDIPGHEQSVATARVVIKTELEVDPKAITFLDE